MERMPLEADLGGAENLDSGLRPPSCAICDDSTKEWFLKESYNTSVNYYRCSTCGHLTARQAGLAISYTKEQYFNEIDPGWESRNETVFRLIAFLARSPRFNLSSRSTILDFGCGVGRLVADLKRAGFDAWGFEPYADCDVAENVVKDWGDARRTLGGIDLLTFIEVLEHLRNPDEVIGEASQLLKLDGYLLVSTGIFRRRYHNADWYYLNPGAGHISIFTEKSLRILLARHGFEPVSRKSELLWLFRKTEMHRRSLAEKGLFSVSQIRVKTKLQIADSVHRNLGADWQPPKFLHRVWRRL